MVKRIPQVVILARSNTVCFKPDAAAAILLFLLDVKPITCVDFIVYACDPKDVYFKKNKYLREI